MTRLISIVGALLLPLALLPASPAVAGTAHGTVVSANPANFTPNVLDGGGVSHTAIYAFHQVGTTMYAGGEFNQVANAGSTTPSFTRNHLMSFSATTGVMTAFAPVFNGPVWAIQSIGSSLYVGGAFTTVNGVNRRGVAKFNIPPTGVPTFDPNFNAALAGGKVNDMHAATVPNVGTLLFIGGNSAKKLMALNPTTGADTGYVNIAVTGTVAPNAGPTDTYRFAINPAGTRLVVVGNFTSVAGQARSRAYMLTLGTGAATLNAWYYAPLVNMCRGENLPAYLRGVDFSPDGTYFAIVSTGFLPFPGGQGRDLCDATARFDPNVPAPVRPTWINYTNGDTLHSVVVTGAAVYVQGHNRWLDNGAVTREGIGAINPVTGLALPWNPGKTRAVGGKVLYATPAGLWVGSDGTFFAGERRDNIAFCPLA